MRVEGAVAVVTGGASGIGAAVVSGLAAAGGRPVVWDLKPPADGILCDVSEPAQVAAAMERTVEGAGSPTIMVACAGIGAYAPVVSIEPDDWERVLAVNLRGTMLCVQAAAREMRRAGTGGSIVCISSVNGQVADRGLAAYCCSKAAVDMLARVAAAELGPDGIRVNAVAPGVTDTPLFAPTKELPGFVEGLEERTPLGAVGTPEQIADAVLALIRADWVTGQVLVADGGLTLHSPIDAYSAIRRHGAPGWRPRP